MIAAGKQRDSHILRNEEKEKWFEDYVERVTTVAWKPVQDTETAIQQVQDDMRNAERVGLTTTKPEMTFEEMLHAIRDILSDLASSNNEKDGEDEDNDEENPVGGKLSKDDKAGWVTGIISNMVQYHMERFGQKQMKLDKLMQPGGGDAADYIRERDMKYGTTQWKVPAVVQPQTADDAASSGRMTFGEPMETLDSVPRELQMTHVTSRPGRSHMMLCSWKPQTQEGIPSLQPATKPDSSPIRNPKHVQTLSFKPYTWCPKQVTT